MHRQHGMLWIAYVVFQKMDVSHSVMLYNSLIFIILT
jgi:hypothetical protein